MKAEIITVGTEILLGDIDDTNASHISRELAARGIDLNFRQTVGDNPERIERALRLAGERSDLRIVTGGLGPTFDDITVECAARVLGVELEEDPKTVGHLEAFYERLGLPFPEVSRRQARVPKGATVIPNPIGAAPGILARSGGGWFAFFPGVPREMKALLALTFDELEKAGVNFEAIESKFLRLFGKGESHFQGILPVELQKSGNPSLAFLAGKGEVSIRATAKGKTRGEAQAILAPAVERLRSIFGEFIFGEDDDRLETVAFRELKERGLTLAVAESCTGGLIASRLTDVPGVSAVFLGGVTAYNRSVKERSLGVAPETMDREGVVSEAVAAAMAEGVCRATGADVGLSITGDAGPTTGEGRGTVGKVCAAVAWPAKYSAPKTWTRAFGVSRAQNRLIMSAWALDLLRRALQGGGSNS